MALTPRATSVPACLAAALAFSGCISVAPVGRARTLAPGDWEIEAGASVLGYAEYQGPALIPVPFPEAGLLVGFADRLELDVRLSVLPFEFKQVGRLFARGDLKIELFGQPRDPGGFTLSLAPGVQIGDVLRDTPRIAPTFHMPVMIGISTGHGSELVLVPQAMYQTAGGWRSGAWMYAASVSWISSDPQAERWFRFSPILSVLYWDRSDFSGSVDPLFAAQFGLAGYYGH